MTTKQRKVSVTLTATGTFQDGERSSYALARALVHAANSDRVFFGDIRPGDHEKFKNNPPENFSNEITVEMAARVERDEDAPKAQYDQIGRPTLANRLANAVARMCLDIEEHSGIFEDRIEVHLTSRQLAAVRNGLSVGEGLDAQRAAQAAGRGDDLVIGPLAIRIAPPTESRRADPSLPPHMQRVEQEAHELNVKLTALIVFMRSPKFAEVGANEAALMHEQSQAMQHYLATLNRRLMAFKHNIRTGVAS